MPSESQYLNTIVKDLGEELKVDVCSLYTINPAGSQLKLVATKGLNQSVIGATRPVMRGRSGAVPTTRRALSVKKPSPHPTYHHVQGSGEEKYQSYLGIPLIRDEVLFGVLVVQTIRAKMFFMSEIKMLHAAGYRVIDMFTETA
jgi:L-methionine (R)-S-oxide reductase